MNYCKLSSDVVYSSMWEQDGDTCKLWITMLALKDKDGVITQNLTGIKRLTGISLEKCQQAVDFFCSPDPLSSSKELDGRRLEVLQSGGWRVVNHEKYQEIGWSDEKRRYEREKKQKYRENLKAKQAAPATEPVPLVAAYKKPRFQKPTKEELKESGILDAVQIEDFYDHFESNGWKIGGKSPMVCWKAAARKWKRTDEKMNGHKPTNGNGHPKTAMSVFNLTKIIEAKKEQAQQLKNRHCTETGLDSVWDNQEKRSEFIAVRKEVKALEQQLAGMA